MATDVEAYPAAFTNAVVAKAVLLSVGPCVIAVGVPVNAGLAIVAYVVSDDRAFDTNLVVAIVVLLSPAVAVGATGLPVNVGLAVSA